jgi:hypothetical protein
MILDDFQYLWDGRDSGWKLRMIERIEWQLTFEFANSGPTIQEVSHLRNLLDDFREMPLNLVLERLRGQYAYRIPQDLSNLAMRRLQEKADQLGLRTSAEAIDRGSYLPIHEDGTTIVIEDGVIAGEVANRMMEAGIAIEIVHID